MKKISIETTENCVSTNTPFIHIPRSYLCILATKGKFKVLGNKSEIGSYHIIQL